jgi:murein DD-endopeptidase MepM/ murein hydrolase activator NlpD
VVNRRYFLVILGPSGQSVRRVSVSLRLLQVAAVLGTAALLLSGGLIVHGLVNAHVAAETAMLQHENEVLHHIVAQMDARVPEGRILSLRSELTFAQLWSKSGLGLEPNVLGIGPLDDDPTATRRDASEPILTSRVSESAVLRVEPAALPLEFDRLENDGQTLQSSLAETLEYFHDAALLLSNTPSLRPVQHGALTSSFGKRDDPYIHTWVMHKGVDLGGQIGTSVVAPADGTIIFTGARGGYGSTIVIDHGYGLQTHYAHLSAIRVKIGDHVQRGETIAAVGSTGRSTGPHLHYEVRRLGQPLNPLRFILD